MTGVHPVAIDSNILIHAYSQTKSGQEDLRDRSRRLLEHLFDRKAPIFISGITVAEFLVKIPLAKHARMIQKLESRFRVAPFSLRAASVAADLVARSVGNTKVVRPRGERHLLMADTKILGSIIATGSVTEIYSTDAPLLSVVRNVTSLRGLELPVDALDLFQLQDEPGEDQATDWGDDD